METPSISEFRVSVRRLMLTVRPALLSKHLRAANKVLSVPGLKRGRTQHQRSPQLRTAVLSRPSGLIRSPLCGVPTLPPLDLIRSASCEKREKPRSLRACASPSQGYLHAALWNTQAVRRPGCLTHAFGQAREGRLSALDSQPSERMQLTWSGRGGSLLRRGEEKPLF